ncbi:MAG: EAL domain-containing protein [Pseudomonadota bacterium]|nr:EAL domain-containing protein [Pseudomonadota bacterium]
MGHFDGFGSEAQPAPNPGAQHESAVLPAWAWSLLALLLGLAVTFWLQDLQQEQTESERVEALENVVADAHSALAERLDAAHLLVRSVQTLFLTSEQVTAAEFSHLYQNMKPRTRLPGLRALVYAAATPGPAGARHITTLVAPLEGNEMVVGLDVADQPTNLAALMRSRDSDQPTLSAPFRLLQMSNADPVDGVVMRLPVYTSGPPPLTIQERRARFTGSVAASFRASSLIEGGLPMEIRERIHIVVSDVTDSVRLPLYDSHPQPHPKTPSSHDFERQLRYGDRIWRMQMHPADHAEEAHVAVGWVLWPGLVASLLLALLVGSVASTRRRALQLGWAMSRRYRESEERFRALNNLLPALVLLARADNGQVTYANEAARLRLGEDLCSRDLSDLFEDPDLREQLREGRRLDCSNAEARLRIAADEHLWTSVSIARVELAGEEKLLMVATDISQQRELTEMLSFQASHDALTELFNRREFERRLERAIAHVTAGGPPAALLYIDLDQFKLINDTSGHVAGDHLLTQLAMMMRDHLRGCDVLARLGGDEFGVLATNVHDLGGAELLAERLRERIDGFVLVWEQRSYSITASIGGVMLDHADLNLKDLLAQADTACYMAKESGRNRVHFYSRHDDETTRRRSEMEWANRLRWAVNERRLLLMYQEIWPLGSSKQEGAFVELLLRFRDEEGRLVAPGAFIPAAERYGLMPMIDRWVISTALANLDRLHPAGAELRLVTINLSGASIEDESLADLILQLLQQHRVAPQRVCFEITETVAVRNLMQVTRFIDRLRAVGCLVALDDFGAGMSSFGYLKSLPVDIIKIDGSFIRDLLSDPMSHSIVRAVTDIGHQRNMLVIAEWVTSDEMVQALVEIGVDYAQGFGLHRPELVPLHHDAVTA